MWRLIFMLGFFICFTTSDNCQTVQSNRNGPKITEIKGQKVDLAAWPVWDDLTQSLYFIDFLANDQKPAIYRYSYQDGMLYSAAIPGSSTIGFVYPVRQGCKECTDLFAVGSGRDVILVKWDGKSSQAQIVSQKLYTVEPNNPLGHTNIAVADRHGRVYQGTLSLDFCSAPPNQSFYRYTNKKGLEQLFTGVRATSGIAIDEEAGKLYHLEGCSLVLTGYDYDPKTGDICNGRVVFDFKSIGKTTDSAFSLNLVIDSNGLLYTTDYRRTVYVIDPRSNSIVKNIDMGINGVSGLAFGGPNWNTLFVLASKIIINTVDFSTLETITDGSSVYKVTGLCGNGQKSTSFKLPAPCNGC